MNWSRKPKKYIYLIRKINEIDNDNAASKIRYRNLAISQFTRIFALFTLEVGRSLPNNRATLKRAQPP